MLNIFLLLSASLRQLAYQLLPNRTLLGSAHFMKPIDRFRLLNDKNDGLAIEGKKRITKELSCKQCLMVSPTGFGKSTRFVLNNLLRELPEKPSLFITDPSGELFEKSAGFLANHYQIRKLDFSSPYHSWSYNPLENIESSTDAEKLAANLVKTEGAIMHGDPFWRSKAIELLTVLIKALLHDSVDSAYQNPGNLRVLLNEFGVHDKALLRFFQSQTEGALQKEAFSILGMEPKLLDGVIATAKAALRLWTNQSLCELTSSNTIAFQDVRKFPLAIFITLPESEGNYYQPLMNQFYTDVFRFLLRMPKSDEKDVYLLLDEFGNFSIPDFSQIVTVARKRRISLSILIQSLAQLEARYGKEEARTLLDNFQSKIFAPGLDLTSCEYLESLLGKRTMIYRDPANNWFDLFSRNKRKYLARSLMTADEIRRSKHPILITENNAATQLTRMKPYFKNPSLAKRSQISYSFNPPALTSYSMLNLQDQEPDQNSASLIH